MGDYKRKEDMPIISGPDDIQLVLDGTRRGRDEAIRRFGLLSVRRIELNNALKAITALPNPPRVPPRVFVSYRWSTPAKDAWVERLAEDLVQRGYIVMFDRAIRDEFNTLVHDEFDMWPTPALVATIASCHIFLAIIDPGYLERTGPQTPEKTSVKVKDGWVLDELDTALYLAEPFPQKRGLSLAGFLREGNDLPRGFTLSEPEKPGNVFDLRNPLSLSRALEINFGSAQVLPHLQEWSEANSLIITAELAAAYGRRADAYALSVKAATVVPDLSAGHAQLARMAIACNRPVEGLTAARRALELDAKLGEVHTMAASCAYYASELNAAAQFAIKALEQDSDDVLAHWALGNALDDLGQTCAGIAHLEIARKITGPSGSSSNSSIHNDTGMAYRHANEPFRALACFARGLEIDPKDELLLENRTAAAIEVGDKQFAQRAIEELRQHYPNNKSVHVFTNAVTALRTTHQSAPSPSRQCQEKHIVGNLHCSRCATEIPCTSERAQLCAGCGAARVNASKPCHICDTHQVVVLESRLRGSAVRCPFCRVGDMSLVSLER